MSLNLGSLKEKIESKMKVSKDKKAKSDKIKSNKKLSEKEQLLKKEALELGATEEDINLVLNQSDGELSEQEFNDNGNENEDELKGGLQDIMKQMGFNAKDVPNLVIDDEDVEEEAQEESEPEQSEQEAEQESEQESEQSEAEDSELSSTKEEKQKTSKK